MLSENKGQSLVEASLFFVILVFIFIALFETGFMIRRYMQLISAGRNAARYAARHEVLDFDQADPGYGRVLEEYVTKNQIEEFNWSDGTVYFHHFLIDTGYPCTPAEGCQAECDQIPKEDFYWADDAIITPSLSPTYTFRFGRLTPSRLDQNTLIDDLTYQNNVINCQLMRKKGDEYYPSINSVIVVEAYWRHYQMLGFPIIADLIPNPIELYSQTTMRRSLQ